MKVLLINPPITHMVKFDISSFMGNILKDNPMPPLGLMYLASYIESKGHEVKILDMAIDNVDISDSINNIDIIGITCTTLTLYDALQVAKAIKKLSGIPIVIGGAHCNIYPDETRALGYFSYIVRGDGEISLLDILNGVDNINNIKSVDNLDNLPFPARYLIDNTKYHSVRDKHRLITTMITSRGCPYHCKFCYQPHNNKWRARSAENVVAEIEETIKLGIHEIEIYDDTFTYNRDRVLKICDLILSKGLKVDWAIRTRVDRVDEGMLKIMKLAGCKRINYGIESVNNDTLKTLGKGTMLSQEIQAIEMTKEVGIEIQAYFMIGSPNETREDILQTIDFANKYIPDYAYYSITTPTPGSELYLQGLKEGKYNDYWKEFACNPTPDFKIRFLQEENRKELVELYNYGYKSFYSRPSYILRQLGKVKSPNELFRKALVARKILV